VSPDLPAGATGRDACLLTDSRATDGPLFAPGVFHESRSMPHAVHWEPEGVCVKFWGTVDSSEITAIYEEISSDERSDRIRFVLQDYLGATRSTGMTLSDVKVFVALEMGASYGQARPVWRAAIASDPSICDFLKYFRSVRTSPDPFQIFSTEREAREWLKTSPYLKNKVDPHCEDGEGSSSKRSAH
jgi:hypothetical protein